MSDLPIDPFNAEAALLFVEGQLYFQSKKDGGQTSVKAIAHSDVRAAFSRVEMDSGWLPISVRRFGENRNGPWFVSFQEPEMHKLNLGPAFGEIEVALPPMLFAGFGSEHYVWALANRRCDLKSPLYYAPLPNVHGDGKICWGQNEPPVVSPSNVEKSWRFFLSAEFNGDLRGGKSHTHDDIRQQLIACTGSRRYPIKDLVKAREQLGWWVDYSIRQGE